MIFLSFPLMYYNFNFNNFFRLIQSNISNKDIFNLPIKIDSMYGNFPFCYWNGDINNNYSEKLPIHDDINNYFSSKTIFPVRLDCSNTLLFQEDLYDVHANTILAAGNQCGNLIEFSDLGVYNYIKEKYKNYNFVISQNIDFIHPLTQEIINCFTDQENFYLLNLPIRFYNDLDFLQSLKNKSKIEINICMRCQCNNIEKNQQCKLQEQHNQIEFSGCSVYENCEYINKYNNLNLINEIKKYMELGFSHFKIESPPISKIDNFNNFLIDNLIKRNENKLLFRNNYNLYLREQL